MNIGQLFMEVLAGTAKLEPQVVAAAQKAGDKGGAALGQRMSIGMGRALASGIGALGGLAFSAAITGANQLDAATRRLQADTGMTADEARKAQSALADMFGTNLQNFDQIADAMARVHNDLGLTGDAANTATQDFLKFSTATGIDAAQAVSLFDDTLDTWGLSADKAQGLMDKLIVSHQKWGGEIDKNLVTLAKVAPAMTAANFSIEDGIALLGLFGAKGLDSERAAAAFSKALTKVKSPAELKALIKDIENTKDPFQRAAKAADLFGAKAGAQLANALGGVNLDDYKVSLTEAADATEKAAKAIESGFGAQFQLILKKAGAALAEFGTNFGPLIMAGSVVGPQLLRLVSAAVGGIGGLVLTGRGSTPANPIFTSDTSLGGTGGLISKIGTGTLLGASAIAAGVAGILAAYWQIQMGAENNKPTTVMNTRAGQLPATGIASLQATLGGSGRLQQLAREMGGATSADTGSEMSPANLQPLKVAVEEGAATGTEKGAAKGAEAGVFKGWKAAKTIREEFGLKYSGQVLRQIIREGVPFGDTSEAVATSQAVIQAMLNHLKAPDAGAQDLKSAVYELGQIKAIQAKLPPKLAAELNPRIKELEAAIKRVENRVKDQRMTIKLDLTPAAKKALIAALGNVSTVVPVLPGHEGGGKTATGTKAPATKTTTTNTGARAAGGPVTAHSPYWVGEHGQRELFVPSVSGSIATAAQVAAMGANAGGNTYQVNVQGLLRARDPFEVANQLRRLADFGVLSPARAYR